jgi:stress-induced morphogen
MSKLFLNFNRQLIFKKCKLFCSKNDNNLRQERLKKIITSALNPTYLEIINESYMHNVAKGSETHFKLIIVSEIFKNKSQIINHQSIYKLLAQELGEKIDNKLHALSLITKTPEEWEILNKKEFESPKCMGGNNINKNKNI